MQYMFNCRHGKTFAKQQKGETIHRGGLPFFCLSKKQHDTN